jgi:hypothetical protein
VLIPCSEPRHVPPSDLLSGLSLSLAKICYR